MKRKANYSPTPHKKYTTNSNLSCVLEFSPMGYLKAVYLHSLDEKGQIVLERSLDRLFKGYFWKRLLSRIVG